ncbi:cell wall hydrolase [Paenibacillus sp. NPDC058071]|uniref:cell wall hydrolase n=1 Tax=Paenibacillus sp. NPDC058071 TaxID=3346326 RepID=UPI0036DD4D34
MLREGKPIKGWIFVMALTLMLLGAGPAAGVSAAEAVEAKDTAIKLDGETIKLSASPLMLDGRVYVPASRLAELLGAKSSWDNDNEELTIHSALGDKVVLGNGVPVVYFNGGRYVLDAAPFLTEGRLYVPLRHLAEMLHATVKVDSEKGIVELQTVPAATVTEEYSLDAIVKETGSSQAALLKRNGLKTKDAVKSGAKLKVVLPAVLGNEAKPYTEEDLTLLAKITMVESGYESYQGQLAIANVILNRVKSDKFPDTIREVIYSGKQFPPAHNGLLDKSKPNASVLRAAKDALNGKNNVGGAVYFFNPDVTKGSFWSGLDVVATIGSHSFAK